MIQAMERVETAAEEAAMLQELERVEAAYAARAGAASTTGETPAPVDGHKESAGLLPPKAPAASVSVKPDPEVCLCCKTPRDVWMDR
jgi:hypothetical protein